MLVAVCYSSFVPLRDLRSSPTRRSSDLSMPDIDVDFCFERRGEVIEYVRQKYGRDSVGQIITFGTLKSRRSEEHTSELQSPCNLVCRLLLEKKKKHILPIQKQRACNQLT